MQKKSQHPKLEGEKKRDLLVFKDQKGQGNKTERQGEKKQTTNRPKEGKSCVPYAGTENNLAAGVDKEGGVLRWVG